MRPQCCLPKKGEYMEMVGDGAGVLNINQDDMNTAKQKYGVMWPSATAIAMRIFRNAK